jgi:hypothetical protein
MSDSKVSQLTQETTPVGTDQLYLIDPLSKRLTISDFMKNIGPSSILTPPVPAQFSWRNQGSATLATGDYGMTISMAALAGDNFRIQEKAMAFSPPYTVTVGLRTFRPDLNFAGVGVGWLQNSDGKLITINYNFGAVTGLSNVQVGKYNNVTTFSAAYLSIAMNLGNKFWMRMQDTGVNRLSSISADGINFMQIHSIGRTDFLTADRIFFFTNPQNATLGTMTNCFSWKEENV